MRYPEALAFPAISTSHQGKCHKNNNSKTCLFVKMLSMNPDWKKGKKRMMTGKSNSILQNKQGPCRPWPVGCLTK